MTLMEFDQALSSDAGVTVWDQQGLRLDADRETVRLAEGPALGRASIHAVVRFADDDLVARGLRARLEDGDTADLLVHRCLQAHADYTYNRNDMLVDTDWIDALGPILAPWAGC